MIALNRHRRFTRSDDHLIVGRKIQRTRVKVIARELGRTPESVNGRFAELKRKARDAQSTILTKRRTEELALLALMLVEAASPEKLGDEQ